MTDESSHNSAILKELSDIKASLAVNTNETANIKQSVAEIKVDIREIKTDFVTRREFNEAMKVINDTDPSTDFEERIRTLEKFKWVLIGIFTVLQALASYVIVRILK